MNKHICGIDFGTSNSAIAAFASGKLSLIPIETTKEEIPSALFFNLEDDHISYGHQAINEYMEGYEGRLLRSLKSVLGNSLIKERTQIGHQSLNFSEIIALFIGHIKNTAEQKLQTSLDSVVMGRPVYFVDNDQAADKKAEDELKMILINNGFRHVSFEYEPIAAAKNYEKTLNKEELVLVFDIGGGTSDFTLMRLSPQQHGKEDRTGDILANTGIHIGGTNFDKNFNLHTIMPHMGYGGEQIGGLPIPASHYHSLSTWHLINSLYTKKNRSSIRDLYTRSSDKKLTHRFLHTIENQRGHELAENVEKAKISLTEKKAISMNLNFIENGWNIPVQISQLEKSINNDLDKIIKVAVEAVTKLGGINTQQVDTIFMTGGSTALPGFEERIKHFFPSSTISHGDRFSSVVTGLGLTAVERYGEKVS